MLQFMPFVIDIVWAAVGYHVAQQKGKNATLWGVLCFLFGLVALIVLLWKKPEPAVMEAQLTQTG